MSYIRNIADHTRKDSLASEFRQKRFELFKSLVAELPEPVKILDVGGTQQFWEQMDLPAAGKMQVTLLNLSKEKVSVEGFRSVGGDARDMSSFEDNEFDILFSNSTIEHLGSWENQQMMAAEVHRISKRYFIQTPNRYFPIEPHFLFPFFQFFPRNVQIWIALRWTAGWYSRMGDGEAARREVEAIRLLTAQELSILFPESTLYREKLLGLTKSFVVYHGWNKEI